MSGQTPIAIRRRLKARAVELGLDFQQAVLYYAMERFLFRLSQTQWSDRLVVKGAVMLRVWDAAVARPTRDIDVLGRVDNTRRRSVASSPSASQSSSTMVSRSNPRSTSSPSQSKTDTPASV